MSKKEPWRIVVTGPESTGKTALAKLLAEKTNNFWVPEYAREYVEHLNRPYQYEDVVQIAHHQILQEKEASMCGKPFIFFDTWLILTKVWFDEVYQKCPQWLVDHIGSARIDLFLVCDTDLPWVADPVRENGGERREALLQRYCDEIRAFGFCYEMVRGFDDARFESAKKALLLHGLKL